MTMARDGSTAGRRPISKPAQANARNERRRELGTDSAIQTGQTRHKMCHLIHFMSRLQPEFEWGEAVWSCGIEGVERERGGWLCGDGSPGRTRLYVSGRGADPRRSWAGLLQAVGLKDAKQIRRCDGYTPRRHYTPRHHHFGFTPRSRLLFRPESFASSRLRLRPVFPNS